MKKIYNILFALLAVLSLASCSNDVDEVFDKSSAERANEALAEYKTVLCSAENGWLMKYYPKTNTKYGGYSILAKFDDKGNVTAMSDAIGSDVEATSHYKLEQSAGIVLSFDDYNKVIHYFSDPVNPDGIGDKGKGMEGDLEFRVLSASTDSVVMIGKKRSAKIVLTPLDANANWATTIDHLETLEEEMNFPQYSCEVGDAKYKALTSYRTITFTRTDAEENSVSVPFIVTDKGIEFYEAITLNGVTITGFDYVGGDNCEFDGIGGNVKMYGVVPPLTTQLLNNRWFFSFSNMGSYSQQYWNAGHQNFLQNPYGIASETYITLGDALTSSYAGHYGLVAICSGYYGCLDITPEVVDDTHIKLTFASAADGNGNAFYGIGFKYYIYALTGNAGITYSIELVEGTPKAPSVVKLTDESNPDNYYIVSLDPASPF